MNQRLKEQQGQEVEVLLVGRGQGCDIEADTMEASLLRGWVADMPGRKTAEEAGQGSHRT